MSETPSESGSPAARQPVIVIAGNPNVGKTTVFNALTGSRQKIANYPGVTVERKEGFLELPGISRCRVIDVPGTYSLVPKSEDEQVAHDVITGRYKGLPVPDLAVYVADASNLERTLFLYSQIRDFGIPAVLAVNMLDIAAERGLGIDLGRLSSELEVSVVALVGHRGRGLPELREAIAAALRKSPDISSRQRPWTLNPAVAREAEQLAPAMKPHLRDPRLNPVEEALWQLATTEDHRIGTGLSAELQEQVRTALERLASGGTDVRTETIQGRYDWLNRLAGRVQTRAAAEPRTWHDRVDAVVTHRFAGLPIFLAVMALMFQAVFAWADPLIGFVETLVITVSGKLAAVLPENLATDLLLKGVIAGVGNVIVFLPQILILFFFLSLLEDIGYMSRAALIAHRIMSRMGLPGKAFIPLMSSFACAIPGILSTRVIEDRRDRLVTICIAPLISCSARLPIYALVIAAVFDADRTVFGPFTEGGLVMLSMYLLSIGMAVLAAALMKRTILPAPPSGFLLELPPYRMPLWKDTLLNMYQRSVVFLTEAGTIILAVTVALWFLLSFPRTGPEIAAAESARQAAAEELAASPDGSTARTALEERLTEAGNHLAQESIRHSYGGRLGRLLEPVIAPLGFDWKIGIGLVGSFAAREVLVSTLGLVYGLGEADETSAPLRERIRADVDPVTGKPAFTPLTGVSLMVFFVLACQCMSTLAVIRRETRSWRWPAFVFAYMTVLAWTASFAVYQGGRLLGFE